MITKKNQDRFVNVFTFLSIIFVSYLCLHMVVDVATLKYLSELKNLNYNSQNNYQTEIPLENATAEYLDYVREIYKYNISNAGKELSKEELIEQGGVCSHYAKLYVDMANKDELNGEYVVFNTGKVYPDKNINAHAVAIISNNKGYCVMDQTSGWCSRFKLEIMNETNS